MQDDTITAAFLDFGSHTIKAALVDCKADGTFVFRQPATVESEGQIRRGIIYNLKEVAAKTDDLLRRLSQLADTPIDRVYAGVNGQSLHSDRHERELAFEESREITEEDMEALRRQATEAAEEEPEPRYVSIADDVTPVYYVDGSRTGSPVGVQGSRLKVSYQLLLAREELDHNIRRVLEEKLSRPTEYLIPATIMSDLMLTAEQKRFGCALVDFGAGCTTVSVFYRGQMVGLRVIPLGGDAITADLTEMHISLSEAERIKTKNGSTFSSGEEDAKGEVVVQTANGMTSKSLSLREVNRFIRARSSEIVRNISSYITALLPEHSLSGIVITGGASRMTGLRDMLTKEFNVKVDYASSILSRHGSENSYYIENPEWHSIYSMVCFVAKELEASYVPPAAEPQQEEPQTKPQTEPAAAQGAFPEDQIPDEAFAGTAQPLIDMNAVEESSPQPPKKVNRRGGGSVKKKATQLLRGLFNSGFFPGDDLDDPEEDDDANEEEK